MSSQSGISGNRLLVVQPYVPSYRVPLFREMKTKLASEGIQMKLAVAGAQGGDRERADDRSSDIAEYLVPSKIRGIGTRVFLHRDLSIPLSDFRPNMVIVEQAIKNVESWPLILRSGKRGNPTVAMWGHGRSYSTSQSSVERFAKQWLTRKSDWFFSYTEAGAKHVTRNGFPSDRITVLNNSTDTQALQIDLASITPSELEAYREMHRLQLGKTAVYIGGLDDRKGIRFLVEAAQRISQQVPGFKLLIGGGGELEELVQSHHKQDGPIVYIGRVEGRDKALALSASTLLLVPVWVGLVAVDSLASRVPIVTTFHESHSPEFDYLVNGETAIVVQHDIEIYSQAVSQLLAEPLRIARISRNCETTQNGLSIESMANNFIVGITEWRDSQSGT